MIRPRTWIAPFSVAMALVAGCGGGGDDSTEAAPATTPTTTALTKAELIAQGDAICAEVNAAAGTAGTSGSETDSPAVRIAGLYSGMVASLTNLGTPQEAEGYAEFAAAEDELGTAEDEVELASERGDSAGLEAAESNASSALAAFQATAEEYGFEECGEGPSAPSAAAAPESGATESGEVPEESEPEVVEPEAEATPEPTPETGGAGGTAEGGGTAGGGEGGSTGGGESGGIGPG